MCRSGTSAWRAERQFGARADQPGGEDSTDVPAACSPFFATPAITGCPGRADALTYEPVGISSMTEPPKEYRLDRWSRVLGADDGIFERARDALQNWRIHEGAGLIVEGDGPPAVGGIVAMAAPLPVGFIEVVCRVVDVVDQPDRCGFVYGTLSNHPEQGAESFMASRSADGALTFEIAAVSRPRQILARAFPAVVRRLQIAATNRYSEAMRAAVAR